MQWLDVWFEQHPRAEVWYDRTEFVVLLAVGLASTAGATAFWLLGWKLLL